MKENEKIWFIYGVWIGSRFFGIKKFYGEGNPGFVEFDWEKGTSPLVLGWVHTHPGGFGCTPSSTDDKTMRSWVRGKGSSQICGIISDKKEIWYLYYRDEDKKILKHNLEVTFSGDFVYGHKK